ncbi:MAG: leucine-rich repeat domain-containing protein, partial [Bacillota bacterium]
ISIPLESVYSDTTPSFLGYYFGNSNYEDTWNLAKSLKYIEILEGIEHVPDYAFYGAKNVEQITFSEGLLSIGDYSFAGRHGSEMKLTEITMPNNNIEQIGEFAFYACNKIESLDIGENIETVGDFAFEGCQSLKEMSLPSAQDVGRAIFRNCLSLEEITVPLKEEYHQETNSYLLYYFQDNLGYTGFWADIVSADLKTINISSALTKVPDFAFWGFNIVEYINFQNTITEIGTQAFSDNSSLKEIALPEGLTKISDSAFYMCKSLKNIYLPSSILNVGTAAFDGCSSLERVEFAPQSLPAAIGARAFNKCQSLEYINIPDNSIYEIRDETFKDCSSLLQIDLPKGIQYIRGFAFESSGLLSINIPFTVLELGIAAFRNCQSLLEINFDYELSRLRKIDFQTFMGCLALEQLIIPESVLEIVNETFNDCISLREVYVLREYNWKAPSYVTMATRLNAETVFENCHDDLTIYVPKNNAGIVEDGVPHPDARNGVTEYKKWFGWTNYADRIFAIPDGWEY